MLFQKHLDKQGKTRKNKKKQEKTRKNKEKQNFFLFENTKMGLTLIELIVYYALTKEALIKDIGSDDSIIAIYSLVFLILCRIIYEFIKIYNQ
jgi:hypothetical protein